jgi:hypothetical protein
MKNVIGFAQYQHLTLIFCEPQPFPINLKEMIHASRPIDMLHMLGLIREDRAF